MPRPDRLEDAPVAHGALLGSAADGASQLPLRLSERAPPRSPLAHGGAARAPRRPDDGEAAGQADLPGPHFLAPRLYHRRRAKGVLGSRRKPRRAICPRRLTERDRESTRLNSSHVEISYA